MQNVIQSCARMSGGPARGRDNLRDDDLCHGHGGVLRAASVHRDPDLHARHAAGGPHAAGQHAAAGAGRALAGGRGRQHDLGGGGGAADGLGAELHPAGGLQTSGAGGQGHRERSVQQVNLTERN